MHAKAGNLCNRHWSYKLQQDVIVMEVTVENLLAVNVGQTTSYVFGKANLAFTSEGLFIKAGEIRSQTAVH